MARVIAPEKRHRSEEIAPGVLLESFYPGGKEGPNSEVLLPTPGGQVWSEHLVIGDQSQPFQMLVPDIRLPANQFWPLHWHDAWTAVLVLEGECAIGDWWMQVGDVFITEPSLEYGPLVIGPRGCRLFEIFAKAHLALGGYAPEYRDHPTLQGTGSVFFERSALNKRNEGRQILPLDGVEGVWKSKLAPGETWDLGASGDPERGVLRDTRIAAGERLAARRYGDWHAMIVLDGTLRAGDRTLARDDYLLIRPDAEAPELVAGPKGAHLLEASRTAIGMGLK